jgi:hypothetical protein
MARIQYQRAAQAGGYRPLQVDERNIARMREETARQIDGMRQAAQAEIQSRRDIAQSMKEDAAYTARAEERNFQIQTANSNRQIQGLQAQANRDRQQAAINREATETIFKTISSFSATASEYVTKLNQQKEDEQFEEDANTESTVDEAIGDRTVELAMREADLNALQGIEEAEANGADPVIASQMKSQSSALGFDATAGDFYRYGKTLHPDSRNKYIEGLETAKGAPLSYEEKRDAVGRYRSILFKNLKNAGISSRFVKRITGLINQSDDAYLTQIRNQKKIEDDSITTERALTNVLQAAPDRLQDVFTTSFRYLSSVNPNRSQVLDLLQNKVFTATDGKGNFVLTGEQIAQLKFYGEGLPAEGITFADKYSDSKGNPTGRYAELLSERVKIQNQFRQQQIQADKLSEAELEDTLARAVMENPTVERLEEAQRMFVATALRESPKLAIIEKSLTYTAQHKQNIISSVSKLRDFELTPEIVAAAVDANPTDGAKIKARYDAYNAKWKSESYKDAVKSVETVVSGTTSFGTTKAAEAGALPMIANLKAELRNRTAMYEPALGFEAAHQKAAGELANEYRNGYRNKDSKFYRKVSRNGTVSYPNLPVGNVSAAERTKRDITDLRTSVKTLGVEGVLDTPLSVTSAERLDYIKKNFYKDTFKPTPKELAFIGMTKGMPLHEAYNRFFEANGDSFRLNSPLRLNGKEVTLTPEDQKVLGDPTKGPQAKLAVINRILNPGMFQSAATMRAGSPFLVYTSGNIGPTSTGQHLDVKQVGGGQFPTTALDEYIEVDDPELGVVPLSRVPITGDFASHTARGSHGIDYGLYEGTKIYAKNGARVISNTPTEHGDKLLIQLPNGKQYTFLHGTAAK